MDFVAGPRVLLSSTTAVKQMAGPSSITLYLMSLLLVTGWSPFSLSFQDTSCPIVFYNTCEQGIQLVCSIAWPLPYSGDGSGCSFRLALPPLYVLFSCSCTSFAERAQSLCRRRQRSLPSSCAFYKTLLGLATRSMRSRDTGTLVSFAPTILSKCGLYSSNSVEA